MPATLDTNILLRWLLGDVPAQTKIAEKLLTRSTPYHVADMAIMEIAYVLERVLGMPRVHVSANIRTIMSQANINCNRSLFEWVLPEYEKHSPLSFVDCCLAGYAVLNEATPLYTFDKAITKKLKVAQVPA